MKGPRWSCCSQTFSCSEAAVSARSTDACFVIRNQICLLPPPPSIKPRARTHTRGTTRRKTKTCVAGKQSGEKINLPSGCFAESIFHFHPLLPLSELCGISLERRAQYELCSFSLPLPPAYFVVCKALAAPQLDGSYFLLSLFFFFVLFKLTGIWWKFPRSWRWHHTQ